MEKRNANNKPVQPAFETFALLNGEVRKGEAKVNVPNNEAVVMAKEFVEINKK